MQSAAPLILPRSQAHYHDIAHPVTPWLTQCDPHPPRTLILSASSRSLSPSCLPPALKEGPTPPGPQTCSKMSHTLNLSRHGTVCQSGVGPCSKVRGVAGLLRSGYSPCCCGCCCMSGGTGREGCPSSSGSPACRALSQASWSSLKVELFNLSRERGGNQGDTEVFREGPTSVMSKLPPQAH
jgi:hypothetical protein